MTEITDVLKSEHEAVENVIRVLKSLTVSIEKPRSLPLHGFISRSNPQQLQCETKHQTQNRISDYIPIALHNLSGYGTHQRTKKRFNNDNIGVIAENKDKYISFNLKINVKLGG